MNANRISQGQMIAGVSAVLLFIFMFLPWFELPGVESTLPEGLTDDIDLGGGVGVQDESFNAWQAENPLDIYLLITILVALGGALLAAGGGRAGAPLPLALTTFLLGSVGALMILYQVFDVPAGFVVDSAGAPEIGRKIGLFLGLLACIGIAVGGYLSMQDEARGERY